VDFSDTFAKIIVCRLFDIASVSYQAMLAMIVVILWSSNHKLNVTF